MNSPKRATLWSRLREREHSILLISRIRESLSAILLYDTGGFVAAFLLFALLLPLVPQPSFFDQDRGWYDTAVWVDRWFMVIATATGAWLGYRTYVKELQQTPDLSRNLRQRTKRATEALDEAAQLMDELRRHLSAQQAARETAHRRGRAPAAAP
ncbi:hypothetical protein AB0K40_07465 [Nonomuraea bangladeshensis]|uniref:Uncharacterized protein n=1 Tax=Nonomuraea bangladeshensis TaxID=404385 RepID=A0ABV3GYG5_9ACTN